MNALKVKGLISVRGYKLLRGAKQTRSTWYWKEPLALALGNNFVLLRFQFAGKL